MATPLTLPPWSDTQVTALRQLYDTTTKTKLRIRYHIVLLAHQGRSVGGIAALPPRTAPGRVPTVTPAWKAELLRVIDLDPHTVGVRSANWTTSLVATYLAGTTQVAVTAETVRLYLHAAGGVCKRPTWTLKRKAEEHPGYVGNACGWR